MENCFMSPLPSMSGGNSPTLSLLSILSHVKSSMKPYHWRAQGCFIFFVLFFWWTRPILHTLAASHVDDEDVEVVWREKECTLGRFTTNLCDRPWTHKRHSELKMWIRFHVYQTYTRSPSVQLLMGIKTHTQKIILA